MRIGQRRALVAMALVVLAALAAAPAAWAAAIAGACCLTNGSCQELIEITCLELSGTFVGPDTSCLMVTCDQPLAAPMLSILGLVATIGALAGLGVFRLLAGRRPSAHS